MEMEEKEAQPEAQPDQPVSDGVGTDEAVVEKKDDEAPDEDDGA
jgi:hypothetical protein